MLVEAYACGSVRTAQDEVPKLSPDYRTAMYTSVLGSVNTPGPMEREEPLKPGVHLHFILPDAFTHSADAETYPAVPDRYHVTRIWSEKDGEKMKLKSFVVDSSFITTEEAYSGSVTIPFFQDGDMRKKWRYLGRSYPADQIPADQDDPSVHLDTLTAIGAGEPLFAAYYPCCRSVFGFHDDLGDLPEAFCGKLSYFVAGYFRDTKNDPFSAVTNRQEFEALLNQHMFSVEEGQDFCTGCVLYGAVDSVDWKGFQAEYCPVPQGKVDAVFGNTSAEALSCLIRKNLEGKYSVPERMLTALQYELYDEIDRIDGNFKIDDEIHRNAFYEAESFDEMPQLAAASDALQSAEVKEIYSRLCSLGKTLGILRRSLAFLQNKLCDAWEQYVLLYENGEGAAGGPSREEMVQEIAHICGEIEEQKRELLRQKNDYDLQWQKLNGSEEKEGILPAGAQCRKSGEPFSLPKEPVLLLGGPGIRRSFAFGEDGRFTSDGTLFCQTAAVAADRERDEILTACFGELPDGAQLQKDDRELLVQTVLLCPGLRQKAEALAGAVQVQGMPPCEIAVNSQPCEWTTLYMIWGAQYMMTRTETDFDNTLDDWRYEYGQTSLTYQGGLAPEQLKTETVQGRILLTPHAVAAFQDVVSRYADLYGEDEELKDFAEQIGRFSIVSQNLDGFSDSFPGRRSALQFPVMGIGGDEALAQRVSAHIPENRLSVLPEYRLKILRGGYVKITDLVLVSSFGQRQVLIQPSYYNNCEVHFAETVNCKMDDIGLLPPAFTFPVRLNAGFMSASEDGQPALPWAEDTPVCGIVIPEMLNRRLLAYTSEGEYLGMVKTAYRGGRAAARWLSAPGKPADFGQLTVPNDDFRDFLQNLIVSEGAFSEFNALMDQYLSAKQNFSSLIWGRPLVLARLKTELEFYGAAEYSKRFEDFGKNNTCQAEKIRFSLEFGDMARVADGLFGHFDDRDFAKLYPAFGAKGSAGGEGYVRYQESSSIAQEDGARYFTVLMEPDSPIRMHSGILPVKALQMEPVHTETAGTLSLSAEISPVLAEEKEAALPAPPGLEEGMCWRFYTLEDEQYTAVPIKEPDAGFRDCSLMDGFLVKERA